MSHFAVETLERRMLLSSGELDPTFGNGGIVSGNSNIFAGGASHAVVVQSDGRIILGGGSGEDNLRAGSAPIMPAELQSNFALARLMPDGALDPSFGAGGKVDVSLGSTVSSINALVLQPDGKIVAVGFSGSSASSYEFAIARFDANGQLDSTFGNGGFTILNSSINEGFAVAVQNDGKIVAAGVDGVVRFTSSGALDRSFGNSGIVEPTTPTGSQFSDVYALALQRDGRILFGGDTSDFDMAIARLNPSGSLDPTFGLGGLATDTNVSVVSGFAIQSDGKIVAAGGAGGSLAVVRLSTRGQLDPTFGRHGVLMANFADPTQDSTPNGEGLAVALQKDGSIVVAGDVSTEAGTGIAAGYLAAIRATATGALDSSFGRGGKVVIYGGVLQSDFNTGQSVAVGRNGILITGAAMFSGRPPTNADFTAIRLTNSGRPDMTFGDHGQVGQDPLTFPSLDGPTAMIAEPNGGALVAGSNDGFYLARFTASGQLDASFATKGRFIDPSGQYVVEAMATAPDGDTIVAGSDAQGTHAIVWRFRSNGTLDPSFANGGKSTFVLRGDIGYTINSVVVQPDGKIVVSVSTSVPNGNGFVFDLVRLTRTGAIDRSFGRHGVASAPAAFGQLVVESGGDILGAGIVPSLQPPGTPTSLRVARYTSSGSPDKSFGNDGEVVTPLASDGAIGVLSVSPVGGIEVAGVDDSGLFEAHYDPTGSPVTAFAPAGLRHHALPTNFQAAVLTNFTSAVMLALEPDGKFIVGGQIGSSPVVIRLNQDGTFDTTFANDGIAMLNDDGDQVLALSVAGDNAVLVAGFASLIRLEL